MIADRDFVVISDDWNGLPTSAIHLFRKLARQNRVFWFNAIGRLPRPTWADAAKVLRTLGNWLVSSPPTNVAQTAGVQVVSPSMVPWFKKPVRQFNLRCFLRKYRALACEHNIVRPVVVTTLPVAADFVAAIPDALKIYYCVDDFLDYPGVNRSDWAKMESDLVSSIDGLVITCRTLSRKRTNNCPLLHLPHGVDFEHFHSAVGRVEPEPRMAAIAHPIVGFFGLLAEWVDLEIIGRLSRSFPDCSFVLLGRAEIDLRPLNGLSNVHYLGWVPYQDLPRYACYFDVGLIPFVLNNLTQAVNPLKLMEYFALGLPVLATRLPELEDLSEALRLAVGPEEFCAALSEILSAGPETFREEAIACARANTWDARAEEFGHFIESLEANQHDEEASHRFAAPREALVQ
jgi:glycosyltransferase involved in cell wall biosynthesis